MTQPFIGEIQLFGFNFNPRGWAFANGATLPISQNTALFSLIGTTYGGNGQTTFQLPNFAGRAGCERGQGPGLSFRNLGQSFGVDTVALNQNQIPPHSHGVNLYASPQNRTPSPGANSGLSSPNDPSTNAFVPPGAVNAFFASNMIQASQGGGFPHENQQPYLGVNFCIALQGIYPSFG